MRVLVTGGAGFIGSQIVGHHLEKHDHVWVVDNLNSGRQSNLQNFLKHPSFRFDQGDILHWSRLDEAVEWSDRIYHMEAIVGQKLVLSNPLNTFHVNVNGCERVLSTVSRINKKTRILLPSSSCVYGLDAKTSYREDEELKILSGEVVQQSYAISKIVIEFLGLAYIRQESIFCVIIRPFNVVGRNQTSAYGMVLPTFVEQALKGLPLTVHGDGKQTRSFCNVVDVVRAMDLLLSTPKANGEIVNVGSTREITIYDLAVMVREKARSKSEIHLIPYKKAYGMEFKEILRRQPNLEKLSRLTHFKSEFTLEQTVEELIQAYQNL